MEVNSNPALNMFLEKEEGLQPGEQPERVLQELDKYVKTKVMGDAIRIVSDLKTSCEDYDDTFEQILPHTDMNEDYYIWN